MSFLYISFAWFKYWDLKRLIDPYTCWTCGDIIYAPKLTSFLAILAVHFHSLTGNQILAGNDKSM